jgi:outer membrane protein assembly factor BamA
MRIANIIPLLRRFRFIACVVAAFSVSSCSPVKDLGPNAYLLNKNIIKSDKEELTSGAKGIIKQNPNRKILGLFRFHLGVYNLANQGKPTKFKRWVKKTIGEEPVVLDRGLTAKSRDQLELYMQNQGYFNAVVTDTTELLRRKRANVTYNINSGKPYYLRKIEYSIYDPVMEQLVMADTANSLLKAGNIYKTADFSGERDRITRYLQNMGYFEFSALYIKYEIDSSLKSYQADVLLKIAGAVSGPNDTLMRGIHKIYRVNNIFIRTDYDPLSRKETTPTDTVRFKNNYFLAGSSGLQFKPEALSHRIFFEKASLYKINNVEYTYRGLANLALFRFVNIRFEKDQSDSLTGNWLNGFIQLSPSPRQDYRIEAEGTHNGGNFGVGVNFSYRNKNVFRGAELFELKLRAKAESIPEVLGETEGQEDALILNTYELGPEITIRVPRFLWPMKRYNQNRSSNPVTLFGITYNYQQRPEYKRNLLTLSTGVEFRESKYKRHYLYPAEINYSFYDKTESFNRKLEESNDQRLQNYYQPFFITNGRYSFIYNSQEPDQIKNFFYLRFNLEVAGNSLRLIDRLSQSNFKDTSGYELFSIPYSQYIRPDFDFRFYQVMNENTSLVYRLAGGIGFAYLNSENMPYEKTFFAGGVNDLRAFRARTIGPGSFSQNGNTEQLGDIKMNANVELRTDIFKILEGALFMDAGNVWLLRKNETQPGGTLKARTLLDEVAIGTGVGLRFDFTFFIFRVDVGVPVRDPRLPETDRWVIQKPALRDTNWNFGIGYPF